jgi:hypothetical protein
MELVYSILKINQRFGATCLLHLQGRGVNETALVAPCFTPVSSLKYFSTPKMQAKCFSETPVDLQRSRRQCIPEAGTLHNHRCENLRPYIFISPPRMKDLLQGTACSRWKSSDLPCEIRCFLSSRHGTVRSLAACGEDYLGVCSVALNVLLPIKFQDWFNISA